MEPQIALAELIRAVQAIVTLGFAAPGIVLIVNLVKVLAPTWKAEYVHLALQVIVWAVYTIATHVGYASQFEAGWGVFITIVGAIASLFTSVAAGKKTYAFALKNDVTLWNYQRTKPDSVDFELEKAA